MRNIILGPPGTGKTTRLLQLVEEALGRGVPPDRIGYVSFTKRAAQEAVTRACDRFGLEPKQLPYFRTLHSLCFHSLGLTQSDVMTGPRIREFGDWLGIRVSMFRAMEDDARVGFSEGDRAMFMENLARVTMTPLQEMYNRDPDGLSWRLVSRVSSGLVEFKKSVGVLDFTDMLRLFVDGGWSPPLEVVFVDEAQDLSMLQWRVVEQICRGASSVFIAGDDDQAIYRWAGAAVEHFVALEGSVEVLRKSWRVPPETQSLATELLQRIRNRREKVWSPAEHHGELERRGDLGTVDLSGEDILILTRNIFSLRRAETELRREGVVYVSRERPSVDPELARAIRLWERLRRGRTATCDECRLVYRYMTSGVGVSRGYKSLPGVADDEPLSLDWLLRSGGLMRRDEWFRALDRMPSEDVGYIRSALLRGENLDRPRIRLSTIHGSKGSEADHVVLMPDMARRTHDDMLRSPEDEARVWYVAVTRARQRLTITKPEQKLHYQV